MVTAQPGPALLLVAVPSLAGLIGTALGGDGFTLHEAPTLNAGVERWKAGGVAAMLLDGSAADAQAAVEALVRLVPEPPVIVVMPGDRMPESLSSALIDAGAQDMVPVHDAVALCRAVRHAIRRQRRESASRAQSRAVAHLLDTTNDAVRCPVGGMIAMARLTLDDPLLPRQRERMESLRDAGLGLMAVLDDLRDLAQMESGGMTLEMAEFDLPALIGAVVTQTAAQSERKAAALTATIEPDVPARLIGDAGRLRQLLVNLAGNAVKAAAPDPARLTVSAHRIEPEHGELEHGGGASVELRVTLSASGPGIGLNALSDRGLSGVPTDGGVKDGARIAGGLGMAICRRLIDRLGGRIGVDSTPGQGSRVWFSLPCRAAMPAAPASLSVLLVEDNAIGRLVAGGFLKSLGHGVTLAEDGAAALALATARLFDLIVMDVQMPVMDGHEATRAIRRLPGAAGRVPIVALTAASDDADDAACRAAGMDDCLHKPLSMDALRAVIGRLAGAGAGAGAKVDA